MLNAGDVTEPPTLKMISRELLKIDDDIYVVKDLREAGKKVRQHVDNTIRLEGTCKAADEAKPIETQ